MSKVAGEIDEGTAAIPRLESLVEVFTIASGIRPAWKCAVERFEPKFGIRHEFIDTEEVHVLCPRLYRGDDVASLITNCSPIYRGIAGHTHSERSPHRSFRGHAWLARMAMARLAGCRDPVNFALKQISSIIQDTLREGVWGATSFTAPADKCYRGVTNCA